MSFVVYSKEWVIADKTAIEAGYVNDPDDSGGATNFGIIGYRYLRYLLLG